MVFYVNGAVANALIHSFMYYQYMQQARGITVGWKSWLTRAQQVRFLWGIVTFAPWPYFCGFSYFDFSSGPVIVWWLHNGILFAFLVLFNLFFNVRYAKKPVSTADSGNKDAPAKSPVKKDQ